MKEIESVKESDGYLNRYQHQSSCCDCEMTFSVYLPPQARDTRVPALYWLSGLTCSDDNSGVVMAEFEHNRTRLESYDHGFKMNSNNSLKKNLKNRKLTIGSWITLAHPAIAEIMSKAGFDWLAIDLEHTDSPPTSSQRELLDHETRRFDQAENEWKGLRSEPR